MENEGTTVEDEDKDEYGLEIHKYTSTVLVVVPPRGYQEETLRHARSSLYNVHVGTRSVSTNADELIIGELQDEFMVDGPLAGETMEAYSGVLFVDGEGVDSLFDDPDCLRLAREAQAAGKLIAAWGRAVAILCRAGVVKGQRLTGDPSLKSEVQRAGGKYTSVQVERSGNLITALDNAAGMRFGKALAAVVGI